MSAPFSAVLLAGGKSTRMEEDKAFLKIEGQPLWRRQIETFKALSPVEIFIAGPPHAAWIGTGHSVLADALPDAGPLGGLVAALRVCTAPLLLVLAVDLPGMTAEFLRQLCDRCAGGRGVVPVSDRVEPLAAFYPALALAAAEDQLALGQYSMQEFVRRCAEEALIVQHPVSDFQRDLFLNLNTSADLSRIGGAR